MSTPPPLAADDTKLLTMLQSVQDHLEQELSHLNALVERKTIQLQGIKSILEDARTGNPPTALEAEVASETSASKGTVADSTTVAIGSEPQLEEDTELERAEPIPADLALPIASAASSSKLPRSSKTLTAKKPVTAQSSKSKQPASQPRLLKSKQPAPPTELRQALRSQFQDKTLAQAVGEVLGQASEAMNAKAVAVELYEGLSSEDLSRATKSVATILAGGRAKGLWQSSAKGLYQSGVTEGRSNLVTAALSGAA